MPKISQADAARKAEVGKQLGEATSLRVDASAVKSGGKRGSTTYVQGIHPSLESVTQAMEGAGLSGGTVTTGSGLQIDIGRSNRHQAAGYGPQSSDTGNKARPPSQEGISQKYTQRVSRSHGHDVAAGLQAEADALASWKNPLRSDGLAEGVLAMHTPSTPQQPRHPGGISRLAKASPEALQTWLAGNTSPEADAVRGHMEAAESDHPRDVALAALGYTPDVQQQMFTTARDRIARTAHGQTLSQADLYSRAHGQLQEHLDEALHGTKRVGREGAQVADLLGSMPSEADAPSGTGFRVETAPGAKARESGQRALGGGERVREGGLGMSPPSSAGAERKAAMAATRTLVRNANWQGARDYDQLTVASDMALAETTKRQAARRALEVPPEERNVFSPGAEPEVRARAEAQPVHSTGTAEAPKDVRIGVPAEVAAGKRGAAARVQPAVARPAGAISPTPPNLPEGPARVGRTREERGLPKEATWVTEHKERKAAEKAAAAKDAADLAAAQAQVTAARAKKGA